MAYSLYTRSFGPDYANAFVTLTDAENGRPAIILATATGGLVNTEGQAKLNSSGNLSVYVDTARNYNISLFDGNTLSNQYSVNTPGLVRAGNQILTSARTGDTTGWIAALGSPERFVVQATGVSGTASIVFDASIDGVSSTITLGVLSLTSSDNGKSSYTPPISAGYPYIRISVVADGGGIHNVILGA